VDGALVVQEVDRLTGLPHPGEKIADRNPALAPVGLHSRELVGQAAVGQLHHDDEPVVERPERLSREKERVPELLDQLQGLQFPLRLLVVRRAGDDLDRDLDATRGLGVPDLAEAPGPDPEVQPIPAAHGQQPVGGPEGGRGRKRPLPRR
jgi:hypothetical protein